MSKKVEVTNIKPRTQCVYCGYKLMAIEMFSRINNLKIEQKNL